MPPVFVTQENINFNGILDDAVVIDTSGTVNKLFPWNSLKPVDQLLFEDSVNLYGGTLPIPQTSAKCIYNFGGSVVGGNPTGLSGTKTGGQQNVDYGAAIGSDPTGLTVTAATAGSQIAQFPSGYTGGTATGLSNVIATSGTQGLLYLGTISGGGDNSGLDDSVAQVTAVVTIPDVAGSLNNTYFTFVSATGSFYVWYNVNAAGVDPAPGGTGIQVDLITNETAADVVTKTISAISGASAGVTTAVLTSISFSITNNVNGAFTASTNGTSGFSVNTTTTGVDATVYTANIDVDGGGNQLITLSGDTVATFGTLISEINLQLTGAIISLSAGDLLVTSSTTGSSSTILITDVDLFTSSTNFVSVTPPVSGTDAVQYSVNITVDGGAVQNITIDGASAQTFTALDSALTTALTGATAALLANGEYTITSSTTGVTSTIVIVDVDLFSSITGFVSLLTPVNGADNALYTATINVDGTSNAISIDPVAATTFTDLVNEINADLTGATATLVAGQIEIVSGTLGSTSSIQISDVDLFSSVNGFIDVLFPVPGTQPVDLKLLVNVDGVDQFVVIDQTLATTFTDLINEINTDLTGAVASIVGGDIEIVSSALGIASSMSTVDLGLLKELNGYSSVLCYPGVDDTDTFLRYVKHADNGSTWGKMLVALIEYVDIKPQLPTGGAINKNLVYFDGTIWRHLFDDSAV